MCARLLKHNRTPDLDTSHYLNLFLNLTPPQSYPRSFPARLFVKLVIKLEHCYLHHASFIGNYILRRRSLIMCKIHYIMYNRCEHWVEQCLPDGGCVRLCRQAEEERLGFPCPSTQREHIVIERSQGFCKNCEFRHLYR